MTAVGAARDLATLPGMSVVLDVEPSAYADAARLLGNEVAECLWLAWLGLQRALEETYGMAGTDDTAAVWGASYESAAAGVTAATQDAINGCYRLAALLERSGANYAGAEASSVGCRAPAGSGTRWATSSVSLGVLQSAVGIGLAPPPGWGLLQHAIGRLWPDGHQDLLHAGAAAWLRAQSQVLSLLADLDRVVLELLLQRAPEVQDAVTVVNAMRSHLADLAASYAGIGAACTAFAGYIDDAHHGIIGELTSFIEATAVIEAAGGLFAIVTFGTSELLAQGGEAVEVGRAASAVRSIIDALAAAAGELRSGMDVIATRVSEISAKVQPILARQLEEVRLAMASDRGEIVIGRKLASQTGHTAAAATSAEAAALDDLAAAADIGPATETWGNLETLQPHFLSHGSDFGATSADDYARAATQFLRRSEREHLPTKIKNDGSIRIYDPKTNTFGSYTSTGKTKTLFKPTSPSYWQRQKGILK